MRVLLPLRKQSANNKQSSNENLVELEQTEFLLESESDGVASIPTEVESGAPTTDLSEEAVTDSLVPSPPDLPCDPSYALAPTKGNGLAPAAKRAWKTTGLAEQDRTRPLASSPRKRPRSTLVDDYSKKPAIESKPPAKPSHKMGLGAPNRKTTTPWYGTSSTGRPLVIRSHHGDDEDPTVERAQGTRTSTLDNDVFVVELKKRGLEIQEQEGDGNCLFRAVSLQVYGDPSMHSQVRNQCLDFMERDKEHFAQFIPDEDFDSYIQRKRQDGVHGNNPEIQAISELFNRPIEVFSPDSGATPLNIFHAEYKTDDAPIRLSYHDGNHYNAVVDPLVPTAGLGLGLPGLQPGLADKMQMAKALAESDATADQMELERALKESQEDELQRAIKESKLSTEHMHSHEAMALSDVDATYFELEQAALEHSLETHVQLEHGKKQRASSSHEHKSRDHSRSANSLPFSLTDPSSTPLLAVASLPHHQASIPEVAAAPGAASLSSAHSVASVASVASPNCEDVPTQVLSVDDYPPVVQELVMNGFELAKVVRAVELIGDDFDDLLPFLMSNTS